MVLRRDGQVELWSVRTLQEEDCMTPDLVFRNPYLLDFLGLEDTYSERDLEATFRRKLERFLLELSTDFSFICRQKRMTIGDRDFYLDLLFYRRSLLRRMAIELMLCSEIRVAEYLAKLPPREMLEAKLHEAIRMARGQVKRGLES
jgi:predicted nuclease of restriction endonuclease-like (RecB) superfamily